MIILYVFELLIEFRRRRHKPPSNAKGKNRNS